MVESDDELAAVLAFEIAAVLANHLNEGKSWECLDRVVSVPVNAFARLYLWVTKGPSLTISPFLAYFWRKREMEADRISMMLMADAGFDPSAAINFRKKLELLRSVTDPRYQQTPEWMLPHPHVSRTVPRWRTDCKLISAFPRTLLGLSNVRLGYQRSFIYWANSHPVRLPFIIRI